MRVYLLLVSMLCVASASARSADCPWKLAEMSSSLQQTVARIDNAMRVCDGRDEQIASLRHNTVLSCDDDVVAQLKGFSTEISGLDIRAELHQAETMMGCIEDKRELAKERLAQAQDATNKMLVQRLLKISAEIERLAPEVFDLDVRAHQLASKLERLEAERLRLLNACAMGDF